MKILSVEMTTEDVTALLPQMKVTLLIPLTELAQTQKLSELEQDKIVGSALRKAYQEYAMVKG
jgi:hypothetical protein